MSLPNAYLRCESRVPRRRPLAGLWKYSLAVVIFASAALDAVWLVPAQQRARHEAVVSAYHDALWHRCRNAIRARHQRERAMREQAIREQQRLREQHARELQPDPR